MNIRTETDDLHLLIGILPRPLQQALAPLAGTHLLEIVLDLGRSPQARLTGGAQTLAEEPVTREDLERVAAAVGEFGADNRAGIEGTLHRVSALRNRRGQVVGLTLRVGRAVFGTIDLIHDLVEGGRSLLLLGRPGVGKTTMLREVARTLADHHQRRVIVVDTSNEIGGDGDVPHPAIGGARRMQVPHPERQHGVMIEAVENHMPEVIIVDEIGTQAEALAARTIAERGVQLIGTAHGTTLANLVLNPTLADLVGGVQTVTLGDEEARLRGTQKTISERKGPPTFPAVVELVDRERVVVHADSARAVDRLLRGINPGGVPRQRGEAVPEPLPAPAPAVSLSPLPRESQPRKREDSQGRPPRIYAYALSREIVEKVIRDLKLAVRTVKSPEQADMILAIKGRSEDPKLARLVANSGLPLYTVRRNTTAQVRRLLQNVFLDPEENPETRQAVREAEEGVQRVISEGVAVELPPQPSALRRVQHRIVTDHRLLGVSEGSEPQRRLVIHPR